MKKILILVGLLLTTLNLMAEPIGEKRAREIATEFFAEHATRTTTGTLELEWAGCEINTACDTGSSLDSSLLYIYNRGNNGGFVVVAGDSNVNPIIAYSLDSTLDVDNMAEATEAILDAWCRQVKNARETAKPISGTTRQATRANDAMLYETALWDQSEPYNREAPVYGGYRSLTGCAATAMAIICYYNKWPERGIGTTPAYEYVDMTGVTRYVEANTLGREYEYDYMLKDYRNGYTNRQGNAVAALMKDMGTSVKMSYHPEGSGATSINVINAFVNHFQYSKGAKLAFGDSYSAEEWNDIIRENIRHYGPTLFCGQGDEGGHAFVVDGFDADNYFHFNFGWSGYDNGYYLIPNIEFYWGQEVILNLEPDPNGTSQYTDNIVLTSLYYSNDVIAYNGITSTATGYQPGTVFTCSIGGIANYGTGTFNGDIKLVVCNEDGVWKQELWGEAVSVDPGGYIYRDIACTITQTFEEGDRIRIYYKSQNSDSWEWVRKKSDVDVDEVLVMASAEDMAKGLTFLYNKSEHILTITNKLAMRIVLYKNDKNNRLGSADCTAGSGVRVELEPGTYIIEASLGSDPYSLVIKL